MAEGKEPVLAGLVPYQAAIICNDVDKTIEYYEKTFGWGPWYVFEVDNDNVKYRGEACRSHVRAAIWPAEPNGQMQIELVQPLEGDVPYAAHLKEKGEGLHHLHCGAFPGDQFEKMLVDAAEIGMTPWLKADVDLFGQKSEVDYMEGVAGGLIVEMAGIKG